jgi:hypothetical protein
MRFYDNYLPNNKWLVIADDDTLLRSIVHSVCSLLNGQYNNIIIFLTIPLYVQCATLDEDVKVLQLVSAHSPW